MGLAGIFDGRGRLYRVCTSRELAQQRAKEIGKAVHVGTLAPSGKQASVKVRDSAGKQAIMTATDFLDAQYCARDGEALDMLVAAINATLVRRRAGDGSGWGQWFELDGDRWQVRVLTLGGVS